MKLLAKAIYELYLPFVSEYSKLESHYIKEQLNAIEMVRSIFGIFILRVVWSLLLFVELFVH